MARNVPPPPEEKEDLYSPPGPRPLVFEQFIGGLNTAASRPGIEEDQMSWCDGFMPLGKRNLRTLPGVGSPIFVSGQHIPGPPGPPPPPPPPPPMCSCLPPGFAWGTDRGPHLGLSNNNLTVTGGPGISSLESVLTNGILTNCKFYFEFSIGTVVGATVSSVVIGSYGSIIGPFNPPYGDIGSIFTNNSFGYNANAFTGGRSGTVSGKTGVLTGWPTGQFGFSLLHTFGIGDTVDVAIDSTNFGNVLTWFRVNNGSWNNSAIVGLPSDPVTGVNGFVGGSSAGVFIAASLSYGDQITANFGPTYARTPPVGFGC